MLTDLSFIEPGKPFPPVSEVQRLKRYQQNRQLFEAEHGEVYQNQFKRIERVIGNFQEVVSYSVITNYQKLMSLKFADLLFGETPIINDGLDPHIEDIIYHSALFNVAYAVALDVSRFGTGLFYIYQDETGRGVVDMTQPGCWFPVVSKDNIRQVAQHVLAWEYEGEEEQRFLKVQIHEKGYMREQTYALEDGVIGDCITRGERIATGFGQFCVIPVHNTLTSDRVYGIDDYMDIDSLVSEIEVRLSQIGKVLDRHTSPTMTGPYSALDYDEGSGEYKLRAGNYIPLEEGERGDVRYITWDAQLEANFKYLEQLINILYTVSETGATLLGDVTKAGAAMSGTALRLRMISPLSKVNRIRVRFDFALKQALSTASSCGWKAYAPRSINIKWRDGLPDDDMEMAQIANIRTGGKPTISQRRAIIALDNVSDMDAREVVREILESEGGEEDAGAGAYGR